jgi:hypothetical protein
MSKRKMYEGVQAPSTGGVQASPSISHGARTSRIMTEKRTKHIDNLVNAKLIPSILPMYIPPLSDTVNIYSGPRNFDYALVTAYLPKGIHTVRTD